MDTIEIRIVLIMIVPRPLPKWALPAFPSIPKNLGNGQFIEKQGYFPLPFPTVPENLGNGKGVPKPFPKRAIPAFPWERLFLGTSFHNENNRLAFPFPAVPEKLGNGQPIEKQR
ncbi:MAG: hypothetical protein HQL91_13910 [Magnetococcales bacterium]|nr:hypothetical protein [Magnetococcales bacterium]